MHEADNQKARIPERAKPKKSEFSGASFIQYKIPIVTWQNPTRKKYSAYHQNICRRLSHKNVANFKIRTSNPIFRFHDHSITSRFNLYLRVQYKRGGNLILLPFVTQCRQIAYGELLPCLNHSHETI